MRTGPRIRRIWHKIVSPIVCCRNFLFVVVSLSFGGTRLANGPENTPDLAQTRFAKLANYAKCPLSSPVIVARFRRNCCRRKYYWRKGYRVIFSVALQFFARQATKKMEVLASGRGHFSKHTLASCLRHLSGFFLRRHSILDTGFAANLSILFRKKGLIRKMRYLLAKCFDFC